MPLKKPSRSRKPELHDITRKGVTTHASATNIETIRSIIFTRSPNAESSHNDTLRRVTTPVGVAIVDARKLSYGSRPTNSIAEHEMPCDASHHVHELCTALVGVH